MAKKNVYEAFTPEFEEELLLEETAESNEEELIEETDEQQTEELTVVIEELRAAIADLEQKEALLTEKLVKARDAGLAEQTEKCRALLLQVVMAKRRKKAELKHAEARALTEELDNFALELENELNPSVEEEVPEDENVVERKRLRAKAKRQNLISKVLFAAGTFAAVVGALIYLLLAQPAVLEDPVPFNWVGLVVDGCALVVLWIVCGCIKAASNANMRRADELELIEDTEQESETADVSPEEQQALEQEQREAFSELCAIEAAGPAAQAPAKKAKKIGNVTLPEVPEKVKENVHKLLPVAAVCTAVVAAVCISSSRKKAAERKRAAAIRRDFFKWLS